MLENLRKIRILWHRSKSRPPSIYIQKQDRVLETGKGELDLTLLLLAGSRDIRQKGRNAV